MPKLKKRMIDAFTDAVMVIYQEDHYSQYLVLCVWLRPKEQIDIHAHMWSQFRKCPNEVRNNVGVLMFQNIFFA